MDVSEQESIQARSAELDEWLKHDPDLETHETDMALHGLYSEVVNYALLAGERAMTRGDTAAAMDLLETALHAREQVFKTPHGPFGFRTLQYIDPFLLEDAAIAGRADLIDRAIALEQANSDAHTDNGGHYDARIAVQMKARESIPHLQSIRDAAEREPGIRQVDLLAHCPGTDRKTVSYLVDQLAALGILATEKIGNRVHVWPAGHADAPTGDRLRQTVRDFLREPDAEGSNVPPWCFHPEQSLKWAQQVLHLMETSLANPERGTTPIPQPTDFRTSTLLAYDAEGHLCSIMEDPDEMVVWGHIGGETMRRILDRHLQASGARPRRRERWLGAEVRHTHLERVSRTVRRYGREQVVWQLREAEAETVWTVPVTVLNAPGKPPRRGPTDDQIIWLAKQGR
ncbi:hypothetical protein [Arthrobacter sp. zg-Y1110]|uniref:hypothetical protein n=1 Tax=Arthrobacter sp. zg-Y1110 TaxID=2886932 RepID=UPI001D139454|nr:hypothetical protein [Arthrobacter sp. zg-Y1110]MCC3292464.1 hypothetical protein [Arthrobacter sp. zg-Y1110]UWX87103.1 hypothetical protein N2K99_17280 [Arthrobacter sp. zg-Y1110]